MRIAVAPFFLLLSYLCSCSGQRAVNDAPQSPQVVPDSFFELENAHLIQIRRNLSEQKCQWLKTMFEVGPKRPAARKLRDHWEALDQDWFNRREDLLIRGGHDPAASSLIRILIPESSETPSVKVDLDMIMSAEDLKKAERAELKRAYSRAVRESSKQRSAVNLAEVALFHAAMTNNADQLKEARENLASLHKTREKMLLNSVEKIAAIINHSTLDRDYAYRAFLREQRRNPAGLLGI